MNRSYRNQVLKAHVCLNREHGGKFMSVLGLVLSAFALLSITLLFTACSNQQAGTGMAASSDTMASQHSSSSQDTSSSEVATNSAEASVSSSDAATSNASNSAESSEALSPEQAAIKSLDGWWAGVYHRPGYYGAYGHVHDSVIDWYFYNPDTDAVEYSSTVDIVRADQFDENGAKGWRFFPSTAINEAFAYYQVEGDENNLPIYMTANGYGNIDSKNYNTDSPERFGISRITDAAALDGDGMHSQAGLEQAKALAKERGVAESSDNASSSSASSSAPFDQAKAEADARAAAEAAGKQIFTGTVRASTYDQLAKEMGMPEAASGMTLGVVMLILDETTPAYGMRADGRDYPTRDVIQLELSTGYDDSHYEYWRSFDGQHISIAIDEVMYPTDVRPWVDGAVARTAEVIAPITEDMAQAQAAAKEATNSPDAYVLAESNTREYSRSELEALDNYMLFLARNEIYARHGRGFKKQELRDHFGGKAWYSETVSPESFDEGVLNEVEKANANLMLEIEKSRNSPYLN